MKNLKPYSMLKEGDPWDNDPSAPWNQPDDPEPEAQIEYKTGDQPFSIVASVPDLTLLKKKSDGSLWVLDTMDLLDTGGDYEDYIYYYEIDDEMEKAENMDDESYLNILVDLYKERKYSDEATGESWENKWDDDDPIRLYKINTDLAEYLIPELMQWSKTRSGELYKWRERTVKAHGASYRTIANVISRAFPEAD
jgi:hypothetical protein